jgi:hypothetical protein
VRQVQVTLDGRKAGIAHLQHARTNRRGEVVLRRLRPPRRGVIMLHARKAGYHSVSLSLTIKR